MTAYGDEQEIAAQVDARNEGAKNRVELEPTVLQAHGNMARDEEICPGHSLETAVGQAD